MSQDKKYELTIQQAVISTLIGGVYMMVSKKSDKFISMVGLLLIGWYTFWDGVLGGLITNHLSTQPNTQFIYMGIDLATFSYFFYNKYYKKKFLGKISRFLTDGICGWFFGYFFVDCLVLPQYQLNNLPFHIAMVILCNITMGFIIYNEYNSRK